MQIDLTLNVNGQEKMLSVATSRTVADVLREDLNLTGCRVACDGEVCGSCTVLIDGLPAAACSTFAFQVDV
jgi:carbon-monoxide dehydrogenase small subunit